MIRKLVILGILFLSFIPNAFGAKDPVVVTQYGKHDYLVVVMVNGRNLFCIYNASGDAIGLSCDWVGFHHRRDGSWRD